MRIISDQSFLLRLMFCPLKCSQKWKAVLNIYAEKISDKSNI